LCYMVEQMLAAVENPMSHPIGGFVPNRIGS
jgi:hypothetical protein